MWCSSRGRLMTITVMLCRRGACSCAAAASRERTAWLHRGDAANRKPVYVQVFTRLMDTSVTTEDKQRSTLIVTGFVPQTQNFFQSRPIRGNGCNSAAFVHAIAPLRLRSITGARNTAPNAHTFNFSP